jgi:hypothetical protein
MSAITMIVFCLVIPFTVTAFIAHRGDVRSWRTWLLAFVAAYAILSLYQFITLVHYADGVHSSIARQLIEHPPLTLAAVALIPLAASWPRRRVA